MNAYIPDPYFKPKFLDVAFKRGNLEPDENGDILYTDMQLVSVREEEHHPISEKRKEIFWIVKRPLSEKKLWEDRLNAQMIHGDFDGNILDLEKKESKCFYVKPSKSMRDKLYKKTNSGKLSATTEAIEPELIEVEEDVAYSFQDVIDVRAISGGETQMGSGGSYADLVEFFADITPQTELLKIVAVSVITQTNDRARCSHNQNNYPMIIDGAGFAYTTVNASQSIYFNGNYNVDVNTIENFYLTPSSDIGGYAYWGFNSEGDYVMQNCVTEVSGFNTDGHVIYVNDPMNSLKVINNFVSFFCPTIRAGHFLASPYEQSDNVSIENTIVDTNTLRSSFTGVGLATSSYRNVALLGFSISCLNLAGATATSVMTTDGTGSVGLTNVVKAEQYQSLVYGNAAWAKPVIDSLADLNGVVPLLSSSDFFGTDWSDPYPIGPVTLVRGGKNDLNRLNLKVGIGIY